MKYTKPEITSTQVALLTIMGTIEKGDPNTADGNPLGGTFPAYSADE